MKIAPASSEGASIPPVVQQGVWSLRASQWSWWRNGEAVVLTAMAPQETMSCVPLIWRRERISLDGQAHRSSPLPCSFSVGVSKLPVKSMYILPALWPMRSVTSIQQLECARRLYLHSGSGPMLVQPAFQKASTDWICPRQFTDSSSRSPATCLLG